MIDYLYKYFYLMFKNQMENMKGDTPQNYAVFMLILGFIIWIATLYLTCETVLFINKIDISQIIIAKGSNLYIFIIIIGLIIASLFYYLMYRRYVASEYYLILYNNSLKETPNKILLGKLMTILYMFFPVVIIIFLFILRTKYEPLG